MPTKIKITTTQKRDALKRELAFRKSVYPKQILEGKMTQQQADYQIAVFQSMLDDYYRKKEDGELGI